VPAINAILLTSVKLFGEALERCLESADGLFLVGIVGSPSELRGALTRTHIQVVLVDVTQDIDFGEIEDLAAEHSQIAFIALGLQEQASQVINAGRSGFAGYVARDASISKLIAAAADAAQGRFSCSGEVACQLLRALFQRRKPQNVECLPHTTEGILEELTRRERDVARLVGRGFSNKEIARDLSLSLATVKHHVHHVLGKLQVRRSQIATIIRRGVPRDERS
jgi:DNA-binding NarL/FixJ family response regulator